MRKALLCACSEYKDPAFSPLKFSLGDVRQIEALLNDSELCRFDDVEVLANPGKADAHEAVERLTADSATDDLILFYFSGHGKLAPDGSVALILSDTKERRLLSSGLLDDQLRSLFNASRARQRVLVLDCCYSGAVGEENFKRSSSDAVGALAQQVRGTFVLTASTKFQPAMECEETAGSVFTSCLVDGVRSGAAAEADSGLVTLSRLGEYLTREVPLRSGQQPKFWDFGGVGATVFAYAKKRFDVAWSEQTLKRLRQMLTKEQIDDTLFVELQQFVRSGLDRAPTERLKLVDDLVCRRIKPLPFLRQWAAPGQDLTRNRGQRISDVTANIRRGDPHSPSAQDMVLSELKASDSRSVPEVLTSQDVIPTPFKEAANLAVHGESFVDSDKSAGKASSGASKRQIDKNMHFDKHPITGGCDISDQGLKIQRLIIALLLLFSIVLAYISTSIGEPYVALYDGSYYEGDIKGLRIVGAAAGVLQVFVLIGFWGTPAGRVLKAIVFMATLLCWYYAGGALVDEYVSGSWVWNAKWVYPSVLLPSSILLFILEARRRPRREP